MLTTETQCRHIGGVPKNVNNENNNFIPVFETLIRLDIVS